MRYKIVAENEYINASYWGNDDAGNRRMHTNELITVSDTHKIYKYLIDAKNLDSIMEPLDFLTLARYFQEKCLTDKVRIAIVCAESNRFFSCSKYNLESMGIESNVFHNKESATKWLV